MFKYLLVRFLNKNQHTHHPQLIMSLLGEVNTTTWKWYGFNYDMEATTDNPNIKVTVYHSTSPSFLPVIFVHSQTMIRSAFLWKTTSESVHFHIFSGIMRCNTKFRQFWWYSKIKTRGHSLWLLIFPYVIVFLNYSVLLFISALNGIFFWINIFPP